MTHRRTRPRPPAAPAPFAILVDRVLVIALVAAALTAGCRATADGPATEHGSAAADAAAVLAIALPPIEVAQAEAAATHGCLRAAGFDPPPPPVLAGGTANLPIGLDQASAARVGYGERIRRSGPTADPFEPYARTLSTSERARFDRAVGDSAGPVASYRMPSGRTVRTPRAGCTAAGRVAVHGSLESWLMLFYLPQELNLPAADTLLHPTVRVAAGRYESCMHSTGHAVRLPQEAVEAAQALARHAGSTAAAPPEERRLAVADARCQRISGIVALWLAEFERAAAPWAAGHDEQIQHAATLLRAAGARARAILADPPG